RSQREHLVRTGHGLGGLDREAGREDGQTPQDHLLVFVKQVVTPIECCGQRLLAVHPSTTARQEAEAVVEPIEQLHWRELVDPSRCQFDSEWDAIEAFADL